VLLAAAALATTFEGHRPQPYRDVTGVLTVCYGHTGAVESRQYTPAECAQLLRVDMAEANGAVHRCIRAPMTPGQEAALTDAAYNVGPAIVCGSTLSKHANAGQWPEACAQLSRWVYAGGKALPGLVKRRAAERAMCEGKR
jgi:lysozyme